MGTGLASNVNPTKYQVYGPSFSLISPLCFIAIYLKNPVPPIHLLQIQPKPIMNHQNVTLILLSICLPFFIKLINASPPSIYDHLKSNGLPMGLFPKGITEYYVDPTSGFFQINLTQPCNAKFENQLHYDFNVSGQLSFGKIGGLSGVSQQELFLWFPVKGIRVDVPSSGLIYFDVGVVDKQFSLSLFENPRDCTAADPDDHHDDDGSKDKFMSLGYEVGQREKLKAVS